MVLSTERSIPWHKPFKKNAERMRRLSGACRGRDAWRKRERGKRGMAVNLALAKP